MHSSIPFIRSLLLPTTLFLLVSIPKAGYCQTTTVQWKEETSKDGKVRVMSRLTKEKSEDGDLVQVVEYKAHTKSKVSLDRCIEVLLDVNKHQYFLANTTISKKLKTISDNEYVVYYFIDTQWPIPDSDCVTRYVTEYNPNSGKFILTGHAVPDHYEKQDVRRMTLSDVRYIIHQEENGYVYLEVSGKFSPVVTAPEWALRNWSPEGPARILNGIIRLAGK